MTYLRDLLHEWAILPSHYDDTFPGGGGSAFAHLTEDTPNTSLVFDWDLVLGDPATPLFKVDASDGSMHWGDGTDAPDADLTRQGSGTYWGGGLRTNNGLGAQSIYTLAPDDSDQLVLIDFGRIQFWGSTAAPIALFQIDRDGSLSWGDGTDALDARIERSAAKTINLTNDTGDLVLKVNGVTVTVP